MPIVATAPLILIWVGTGTNAIVTIVFIITVFPIIANSTVGLMSAEIFGYDHSDTRVYARDLGIAFQLTNILRDVGEDARRGRIYLPQDDLARFDVAPSSLLGGKGSHAFRRLMAFEADRTRAWYARALAKLDPRDRRSQRAGLIMAAIYQTLLDEIARDGFDVLDRRTSLTPLRKLWIAWKTARKNA